MFISSTGVFEFDQDSFRVVKLCGKGPDLVTDEMLDNLFKFNSGQKKFMKIPAKQISISIDGFTVKDHLWQTGKAKVGPKTKAT